ncbi:MAG: hypothetical protein SGJ04_02185 [Bacteroidota bacterium]|nr:hypothetical protein [Bacteroidota bacterium]
MGIFKILATLVLVLSCFYSCVIKNKNLSSTNVNSKIVINKTVKFDLNNDGAIDSIFWVHLNEVKNKAKNNAVIVHLANLSSDTFINLDRGYTNYSVTDYYPNSSSIASNPKYKDDHTFILRTNENESVVSLFLESDDIATKYNYVQLLRVTKKRVIELRYEQMLLHSITPTTIPNQHFFAIKYCRNLVVNNSKYVSTYAPYNVYRYDKALSMDELATKEYNETHLGYYSTSDCNPNYVVVKADGQKPFIMRYTDAASIYFK